MALVGEMQYLTIGNDTYSLPTGGGGGGSVTSVAVSNATDGGLSVSGSPITSSGTISIGHSNVLTSAQTTQAVYPITIDKNGHISEYGSAVTVPTKVSDLTNDSGYLTESYLLVTFNQDQYTNEWSCDKTFLDIKNAYDDGKIIIGVTDNSSSFIYTLTDFSSYTATFSYCYIYQGYSSNEPNANNQGFYVSNENTVEAYEQLVRISSYYGKSTTSASTAIKKVTSNNYYYDDVKKGTLISVTFTNANTYTSGTLYLDIINDATGKAIHVNNAVTSSSNTLLWDANETLTFIFDGTYFRFIARSKVPTIPTSATSSTTGISVADHSTSSIYGVQSSTTSVTGVQSTTTTASKASGGNGTAPSWTFEEKSIPNVTAAGSGSFTQGSFSGGSLTMTMDSTDTKKLNIVFTAATHGADSHTHTAPTLGTAIKVQSKSGGSNGSASTWSFTDVTVPIKNTSATTVPIKDTSSTTVVTSKTHTITDNGHTHTLG